MTKLYILCGYPFAGKSTLAQTLIHTYQCIRIALDDINNERGVGKDVNKKLTPDDWQATYDIYHDRIVTNLKHGNSVIADTVGHTRVGRDGLRKLAKEHNAEAVVVYLVTPLETAKARWLQNRKTQERADVRDKDFYDVVNNFEVPGNDENVKIVTPAMNSQAVLRLIEA